MSMIIIRQFVRNMSHAVIDNPSSLKIKTEALQSFQPLFPALTAMTLVPEFLPQKVQHLEQAFRE